MTTYQRIADKLASIFASDLFTPATISRASVDYDPRTLGSSKTPATIPARAVINTIKTRADNGAIGHQTLIYLNTEAKSGDKITIAGKAYVAESVAIEAPDGVPIFWTVTVKA